MFAVFFLELKVKNWWFSTLEKYTKARAIFIECYLCDDFRDMNRFNAKNMANAIAK
ncbi:bacteriophage endolysin [Clostridium botulinum A3 str. Loch Maree]|nr:hypothetical protein [Clostridium botulinum]ACA54752.1 bacteriophage endolysin [Clostridium botulinum A3 str. Loch Maree]